MTPRTTCPVCDRLVPANVDGSPKRHPRWTGREPVELRKQPCVGGAYDLHGILMSDPMSRAIREGRKSVTRRMSDKWGKLQVGDRLWVREVWSASTVIDESGATRPGRPYLYRCDTWGHSVGWKSSLIMPFSVCRTLLEVTEPVRREPVRAITDEEAVREGAYQTTSPKSIGVGWSMGFSDYLCTTPSGAFCYAAWNLLHPGTWFTAEPWRIAFRVLP